MTMQSGFASTLSLALAHSLWQLALLGLLAAPCMAMLRQSSAALRHVVGMAWLLAMACAPVATVASYSRPATLPQYTAAVAPWPDGSFVWVTQLWLLGVVLMVLLHIGGGWRMLRRLERAPYAELPPDWQRRVEVMSEALGITRIVAVRLAASVGTPFTARMLRPVIWLPHALLSQLPVEQIKALLAHELAHIRRLDWLWNGIQCVIESLLFFHPAMWWLSRSIRQDREHACDDLARIRHILSQPPARTAWRGPAFLVLLLSSGMLFAMQAEAPRKMLSNLHSPASPNGSGTLAMVPPPPAPPVPAPPAAPAPAPDTLPALSALAAPAAPPALPALAALAAPPALPALAALAAPPAPPAPAAMPAPPAPPAVPALPAAPAPALDHE